ncbi:DUF2971 domain-containing protein [Vibrio parahaemolyticus]|nr:DUF2971 domain-containing protein [Vibrio parahaemolyticus]
MKVYKYTPHIKLFLESSAMKLTPIIQLNDPFEAKLTDGFINNFDTECRRIFKDKYNVFSKFKDDIQENSRYKGIVSLSRKPADIIMLSHYASNHVGGILEFEVDCISNNYCNSTSLFDRSNDKGYKFGKVKYKKSRRLELNDDFHEYLERGIYFEKYTGWSYEEEVRYMSDFRYSDYIVISKKSLVENYFESLSEQGFLNMMSWHIEGDSFYYVFESFDIDKCEDCLYRSKKKKIRSIIGKIFGNNIHSYEETGENVILKLKCNSHSYFAIDQAMSWHRFLARDYDFHPMIKVNREALTGVYLGCKFNTSEISESSISDFPNLCGNVMQAQLCGNDFKLNLVKAFEVCN